MGKTDGRKSLWEALEGAGLIQGAARYFMTPQCEGGVGRGPRMDLGRPRGQAQNSPLPKSSEKSMKEFREWGKCMGTLEKTRRTGRELLELEKKRRGEFEIRFG